MTQDSGEIINHVDISMDVGNLGYAFEQEYNILCDINKIQTFLSLDNVECLNISSGYKLNIYKYICKVPKKKIVMINPAGISAAISCELCKSLSLKYDVYSIETRGAPDFYEELDRELTIDDLVDDVNCIVEQLSLDGAEYISFCSGASILTAFASKFEHKVNSLTYINPSLELGDDINKTLYQETMIPLWCKLKDYQEDKLIEMYKILSSKQEQELTKTNYLYHVNNLPSQDIGYMLNYSILINACHSKSFENDIKDLDKPIVIYSCKVDELIDPALPMKMADISKKSNLKLIDCENHLEIIRSDITIELLLKQLE